MARKITSLKFSQSPSQVSTLFFNEILPWAKPSSATPFARRAIAMGRPLDATGAMILGMLIDELQRRQLRYGMATLCVGGGMGIATIVETL